MKSLRAIGGFWYNAAMKPLYLVETVTKDTLVHQGMYFKPSRPALNKTTVGKAILWVHGLTGSFYSDTKLLTAFTEVCEQEGIGFAAFNNRGHDHVSGFRKIDNTKDTGYFHETIGAAYETFDDCIYDIDSGISFLEKEGYTKIFLTGHSTGANKVCFYASTKHDKRVAGVILAGPLSDRLDPAMDRKKLLNDRKTMNNLIKHGKGDDLLTGFHFFPLTPKRYLSLFGPASNEDMFDYGDKHPKLKHFSAIRIPTMVIIGENDEYADRSVKEIIRVFDERAAMREYASVIVPHCLHDFGGNEKEAVCTIIGWIRAR